MLEHQDYEIEDGFPAGPEALPGDENGNERQTASKRKHLLESPWWRYLGMPLLTNVIPLAIVTYFITSSVKDMELADRPRAISITVQSEIIKEEYGRLRELANSLRRQHREIDEAVSHRARGTTSAEASPQALKALAEIDDVLYFISRIDALTVGSASKDLDNAIKYAREFTQATHDCLARESASEDVAKTCGEAIEKHKSRIKEACDSTQTGQREPSLTFCLVDNAMLALRRLLPLDNADQSSFWGHISK